MSRARAGQHSIIPKFNCYLVGFRCWTMLYLIILRYSVMRDQFSLRAALVLCQFVEIRDETM
jgi:hypothetical protein